MKRLYVVLIIIAFFGCNKEDLPQEDGIKYDNYFLIEADTFLLESGKSIIHPMEQYELNQGVISVSFDESLQKYYFGILLLSTNAILVDYENGTKLTFNGPWNGVYLSGLTSDFNTISDGEHSFELGHHYGELSTFGPPTIRYDIDPDDNSLIDDPLVKGTVIINKQGSNYEINFTSTQLAGNRLVKGHFKGDLKIRTTNTTMLNFWNTGDFINCFIYEKGGFRSYELTDCILKVIEKPTNLIGPGDLHPISLYSKAISDTDESHRDNPQAYKGINVLEILDDGRTDERLSNGIYNIGTWSIYEKCILRFNYNFNNNGNYESEVSLKAGVFTVNFKDNLIKIDLSGTTDLEKKNSTVFAHYEGKYRLIEE